MSELDPFDKANGPRIRCRSLTAETFSSYNDRVPGALVGHWREVGVCGYRDGVFWFTDPSEFETVVREWLGGDSDAVVIARTAFADLFLWIEKELAVLNVDFGKLMTITPHFKTFFNRMLVTRASFNDYCPTGDFQKAKKRLGDLEADECYGYFPAPALGGPGTLETLRKVKIREYLGILSQAVTVSRMS